ncbi:MAG: undecaprenyldiphospho-muramoylpentapeptide beta-N-acetylglucosaminyltransferase [Clostridia bacterium]|nr:undecaprenyldiphospho-muramoylpentapeptide beta-N-acetylglucosaminyltransferase [Clostridia bacterium]
MKILFCGGGTGGHVTPAIAMAQIITRFSDEKPDITFIGRRGGAENDAVTREGFRLLTLDVCGIRRSVSPKNFGAVLKALHARSEAKRIIAEASPDLIVGTGGYVSWPVISAGISKKIPTVIHESNAYPGLVTRLLGKKCTRVLLGYPEAKAFLRSKRNVRVVGNPIKTLTVGLTRDEARRRLGIGREDFFILSFGGSLGAKKINSVIRDLMLDYSLSEAGVVHWHATGRAEFENINGALPRELRGRSKCRMLPYIEDMPVFLRAADLAITRSGAMTVSELAEAALPAILVPSPNVVADHQYSNARAAAKAGGAVLIEEAKLTSSLLRKHIDRIRRDRALQKRMSSGMRSMYSVDTPRMIFDSLYEAAASKRRK